jgi:hypothetical protein
MKSLRKRCAKCGRVEMVKPRVRRCKRVETRFGRRYYCWGALALAPIKRAPKPSKSKGELLNAELLKTRRYLADALRRQKRDAKKVTVYATKITKLLAQQAALGARGIVIRDEQEVT